MSVLITGANGFLGYYLTRALLEKGYTVIATGKGSSRLNFGDKDNFTYREMDFTEPFQVHDVFGQYRPDVVIHAGAISKVDECELDQWEAYRANTEATVSLLVNAEEYKSFFVFVSTDFVFDGEKGMYREDDEPHPINFYGKTKEEAEEAVKE
jgi:dTDP-4-dehydrorhamnose reductase